MRCQAAGISDDVAFATKPAQAQALLEYTLDAGVPAAWVTAGSVYGNVKYLRVWLEAWPIGYVLAVSSKDTVVGADWQQRRSSTLLADPPPDGRERMSAGAGALAHAFRAVVRAHGTDPLTEAQKGNRPRDSLAHFWASRRATSP